MHSTTPYHYNIELLMFGDWILFKYIKFSKSYTKYLDAKIILYKKIVNFKVLDLAEHYLFDAIFISNFEHINNNFNKKGVNYNVLDLVELKTFNII